MSIKLLARSNLCDTEYNLFFIFVPLAEKIFYAIKNPFASDTVRELSIQKTGALRKG